MKFKKGDKVKSTITGQVAEVVGGLGGDNWKVVVQTPVGVGHAIFSGKYLKKVEVDGGDTVRE